MNKDPIVDEIRKIRQKIFANCDLDLNKLMDFLKVAEKKDRNRIITKEIFQKKQFPKSII